MITKKEQLVLKKVGLKIKQLRTEKGISQLALGIEVDIEKSNISRLESGRVNVKILTLYKIAEALNISTSELLNLEEE